MTAFTRKDRTAGDEVLKLSTLKPGKAATKAPERERKAVSFLLSCHSGPSLARCKTGPVQQLGCVAQAEHSAAQQDSHQGSCASGDKASDCER